MNEFKKVCAEYGTTTNRRQHTRVLSFKDLLLEQGYDVSIIPFKNRDVKFMYGLNSLSICQVRFRPHEWNIYHINDDCYNIHYLFNAENRHVNPFTVAQILDVDVDLSSFYHTPSEYNFVKSARYTPQYIAAFFWNKMVEENV